MGGHAPSEYLARLQAEPNMQASDAEMDAILVSHAIDPDLLRANSFDAFLEARRAALVAIVERAMGKTSVESASVAEDELDVEDGHEDA